MWLPGGIGRTPESRTTQREPLVLHLAVFWLPFRTSASLGGTYACHGATLTFWVSVALAISRSTLSLSAGVQKSAKVTFVV